MNRISTLLIFFLFLEMVKGQDTSYQHLLVSAKYGMDYDNQKADSIHVLKYSFNKGVLTGIDTVLRNITLPDVNKLSTLRDGIKNYYYANRYLVSQNSVMILDIKEKKFVLGGYNGYFHRNFEFFRNDSIFLQKIESGNRTNLYYVLDMVTGNTSTFKGEILRIPNGYTSPDGKYGLIIKPKNDHLSIFLQEYLNNPVCIIEDIGIGCRTNIYEYGVSEAELILPVKWIDSSSFVYVEVKTVKTRQPEYTKATVYQYRNGISSSIGIIDTFYRSSISRLFINFDVNHRLLLGDTYRIWHLDLEQRTITPLEKWNFGYGFETIISGKVPRFRNENRNLTYLGVPIISSRILLHNYIATDGYIVDDSLRMWDKFSGKWTKLSNDEYVLMEPIGWIYETKQ